MDPRNRSGFSPFVCLVAAGYLSMPAAFQDGDDGGGLAWWVWLLIILVLLVVAIWLWTSRRESKAPPPSEAGKPNSIAAPVAETRAETVEVAPDDLEIIEGIGPKIAAVLKAAGIVTFAQLAEADPAVLHKILQDANLRLADPSTWGDQARLAAAGDMEGLKQLQDSLTAGRAS
jgi:predicted flap endonuclease-1-like 5' DNA nuclease